MKTLKGIGAGIIGVEHHPAGCTANPSARAGSAGQERDDDHGRDDHRRQRPQRHAADVSAPHTRGCPPPLRTDPVADRGSTINVATKGRRRKQERREHIAVGATGQRGRS